jgi:hypothetical protein
LIASVGYPKPLLAFPNALKFASSPSFVILSEYSIDDVPTRSTSYTFGIHQGDR